MAPHRPETYRGPSKAEVLALRKQYLSPGLITYYQDPLLIVEILSPSTDRDDVFVKLPAYQRVAGLQEILYVETERIGATVYRRAGEDWQTIELAAPEARLRLETVGLDIALSSLYRGIPGL